MTRMRDIIVLDRIGIIVVIIVFIYVSVENGTSILNRENDLVGDGDDRKNC